MHDVITKTLPANMALLSVQREAATEIEAKTAQRQDSAMIERDLSRGARAPEPAAEDPIAAVRDAIDELIEFASEDAINAGSFNPSLQGPNEPNVAGMQRYIEGVLDEVRKLMGVSTAPVVDDGEISLPDWLLTSHNPDRRPL